MSIRERLRNNTGISMIKKYIIIVVVYDIIVKNALNCIAIKMKIPNTIAR